MNTIKYLETGETAKSLEYGKCLETGETTKSLEPNGLKCSRKVSRNRKMTKSLGQQKRHSLGAPNDFLDV